MKYQWNRWPVSAMLQWQLEWEVTGVNHIHNGGWGGVIKKLHKVMFEKLKTAWLDIDIFGPQSFHTMYTTTHKWSQNINISLTFI